MATAAQIQETVAELLGQILEAESDTQFALEAVQRAVEGGREYRFITASQSNLTLETSVGAIGDYIAHVLVIPTTSSPGAVSLKDGSGTAFQIYAGTGQQPVSIPIGIASANGAWQITTGTNVTALVSGEFS